MQWSKPMVVGLISGILFLGTMPAGAQTVDQREMNQQRRIEQGVRSGEITPKEFNRLEKREANIQRTEGRMKEENGGSLTPGERARLNRRLNRTSRAIYRDKHNDREVPPAK
jgi:hypothetical protein